MDNPINKYLQELLPKLQVTNRIKDIYFLHYGQKCWIVTESEIDLTSDYAVIESLIVVFNKLIAMKSLQNPKYMLKYLQKQLKKLKRKSAKLRMKSINNEATQ